MFELKCPYCESEQEPLYDNAESGVWFNHKCTNCSKVFIYQIEYWPTFKIKRTECKNDGEHVWASLYPEPNWKHPFYPNAKKCDHCSKVEWGELNPKGD